MDDAADELDEGALFPIVGIGASAGGLEAFTQLLKALPLDTGMGFVLVQHLDPEHESALTQILTRATSLPVYEVTNNQVVQANHVYIIPPDTNLSIAQGILKLEPRPKVRTPHRPIDTFFESLSQDLRERAIGVVLSGTASDGTLGLEAINSEGGITFAQDDSAKYDSMPRSAVAAGCVDLILSPADIAKELARIAKHPYVGSAEWRVASDEREQTGGDTSAEEDHAEATSHGDDHTQLPSGGRGTPPTQSRQVHAEAKSGAKEASTDSPLTTQHSPLLDGYRKIVLLLRSHSGVDFSLYKSNTIQRRITRRLVLSKLETLEDYAGFLRGNAKELDALYSDVLISVTSFFRNPEMFDVLQREVFPKLLKQPGDQPIRVWVLGCSTGQEAYSIAMAFLESAEKSSRLHKLQVFATDLNDTLLDKARNGLYAKSLADDITPERLRRFFNEEQGGYRVCKMLREMVVFARQNLIADTPFSRMDLVSCRNLLIYLEPSLQKKAMPTFHFALKPGGFLLLGASESIGGFTDLFEPVDKKYKIYSKKPAQPLGIQLPVKGERDEYGAPSERPLHQPRVSEPPEGLRGEHNNVLREADRIALSQYAPPGVVVNEELQVLQFRGPTGAYLEPPIGKASFDLLKMAREGLMLPLRSAINQAKKEKKSVCRENVRVKQDGKTRTIRLEIIPLKNLSESGFLILFDDAQKAGRAALASQAPALIDDAAETGVLRPSAPEKTGARQKSETHDEAASRIADLETELCETREYLQSIQEQHEAATEELQAASEEVQSSNEELQSINEELETSKEEMESANEELTTVNEEMSNRNVELDRVNNDLVNLQTSAKLAIVLLGRDLTIRRFSPQAEKQFDLLAADMGRPISHIRHNLVSADAEKSPVDLRALAAAVIADVREQECEVRDNADRWHLLRVRPYMTLENKVDGAVLVLVEIDALKRSEQIAKAARIYAENTLDTVREPMLVLDHDLRVESANGAFYRTFRVASAETVGTFVYELGNRQWNIPRLRELLHETLSVNQSVEDFEVEQHFEQLGHRIMLLNARRIIDPLQNSERILLAITDITDRKQAERALLARTDELETLLDTLPGFVWISRDAECRVIVGNRTANEFVRVEAGANVSQSVVATGEAPYLCQLKEDGTEYRADELPLQRAIATGLPVRDAVLDFRFRDGRRAHVVGDAVPLFDEQGRVRGGLAVFVDITERKRAEEARHEMERNYRALAAASSDIAYRMSADWSAMLPLDGRQLVPSSDQPLAGWAWLDQNLPRDEHPRVRQAISDAIARKALFELEHRVRRPDGSDGWTLSRAVPIFDENEDVIAWFGAASDITRRKQAETLLKASEIHYRRLFESAKDGILMLDAHAATITDANPFMAEMLGYSHDEFVGKELWQIGLFKDVEASKAAMRELQEKGYIRYEDQPLETKAGRRINVEFVSNVYGENGEAVIQCNVRDITKRRETERLLEKALVYTDDIIATLREPFVVLNADLRVRTANRSFYDSFHVSKGETENQFVYDLGNGQWDIPALRTLLDQVLSRNESVHDFEVEHTFPALGRKSMLLNARPFPPDSKHPELILLAVEDVSAARERADELAAANRHKDEFLATLAHELRNPLAPIHSGLQLMKLAGDNPDVVENSLRIMERQVSQMTHLIDDLMDLSRISGGKIVLQKVRLKLADVIQDAVDTSRPLIEERGHDLVLDFPPEPLYVDADRTRLAQVFGNLLNNAAKYTDTGGRIRVAVERQGGDVVVTVEDNGVGIAAHLLTYVFDMFSQVDRSLEKSQGGLGIGLNIVKRLAEMHDGSIVAESGGHGAGSRFVVRLPIALSLNVEQRDERVESVVESVTVAAGRRILVVDDNRDAAISLAMMLKVMGYELQTAHDGFEALDLAATFRPDLVLLDIGMPKLNGYDTARRIREQAWGKNMVLVALTGWGQDEDKRKSQEAGFDDHLVKPIDFAALDKLLGGLKTSTA